MPRPLTPSDLRRLKLPSDARISPDGRRVAFVLTTVDEETDGYRSRILLVDADAPDGRARPEARPVTHGPGRDWAPRWSPDGRRLAFLSDRPDPGGGANAAGRGPARLWILDVDHGGEAMLLPGCPAGAGPAAWSPDGGAVAFSAPVAEEPPEPIVRETFRGSAGEYADDARVIATAFYREDGEGYRGASRRRIVVARPDGGDAVRFLGADGDEGRGCDDTEPAFSPDGRFVAFVRRRPPRVEDQGWGRGEIWIAEAATGRAWLACRLRGPADAPAWLPDGSGILFFGHGREAEGSTNVHVYRLDLDASGVAAGEPRDLVPAFDRSIGNHNRSYERGSPPHGVPMPGPDGAWVLFIATDGGEQPVWAAPVAGTGGPEAAPAGPAAGGKAPGQGEPAAGEASAATLGGVVRLGPGSRRVVPSFSVSADGRRVAAIVEHATSVGDVHVFDVVTEPGDDGNSGGAPTAPRSRRATLAAGPDRRFTAVNDDLYKEVLLAQPERFTCEGAGGWTIEGWLLAPPLHRPGERHPLVLNIHGGPHGTWGYTLMFENQLLAGAGYAVVYGNPRGGQGYGQAFTAAVDRHWGEDDFRDLLALVDHACERDVVDPERIGVMGNSYGGFMTNWLTSHDGRFKAAVTQGTISNRASDFGTSDYGFVRDRLSRDRVPWNPEGPLWDMSPLKYVENVKAPTLILHGEMDFRCPVEQGEQWFAALQCLGVPVVMVRYPGASHGFTRTGRPSHRVDRLRRHLDWFDRFLKGADDATADASPSASAASGATAGAGTSASGIAGEGVSAR